MTLAEALETTRIHRAAGLTGGRAAVVTTRPFRAPHHTRSAAGRIGGCADPDAGGCLAGVRGVCVVPATV